MFKRLTNISKSHSFFLFGPRSTGKTTLLKEFFKERDILWIDLLNSRTESQLRRNPESLTGIIAAAGKVQFVIIDEIQKNPILLDSVQRLMVEKKIKFILTGSSARKLRRGHANLLGGRAFRFDCFPLTHLELANSFVLSDVLQFGSLPEVFSLEREDKVLFLRSYVESYFREEVVAEQLIRNLLPFRNFLEVAAQANGTIVNINNIAKSLDVDHTTVQNYFSILEDTMLSFHLPPYHASIRERQASKSKFYYFDLGVQRALTGLLELDLTDASHDFGRAFEHFIICEFFRLIRYKKPDWKMFFLRTRDNAEIDLVIERPRQKLILIEIKSTEDVQTLDKQKLIGFKSLSADIKNSETYLISRDPLDFKEGHIHYMHWNKIFEHLRLADPTVD
jgi:predicted AAA+ superfamily ATPase